MKIWVFDPSSDTGPAIQVESNSTECPGCGIVDEEAEVGAPCANCGEAPVRAVLILRPVAD